MKFTISIALLAYSIHAAPAHEARDSSNHPIMHNDSTSTSTSIRTSTFSIDSTNTPLLHPTARVIRPKAPTSQIPISSDYDLDSQDPVDSESALLDYWTAHDCPSTLPSRTCYRSHSDFPPVSQWLTWDCLISQNLFTLLMNNGPDEVFMMIASIKAVADAAGIDPRIPFALIMQATFGAVRPPPMPPSHGLFQVQIPDAATCANTPFNTCAPTIILAMIQDGIFGHHNSLTSHPVAPGIGYWIPAEAGDVPRALRAYNSGKVLDRNDLTQAGRTGKPSFVSDVANWLVGSSVGIVRPVTCL